VYIKELNDRRQMNNMGEITRVIGPVKNITLFKMCLARHGEEQQEN